MTAQIVDLAYYPIKGCRAAACQTAQLEATGLRHDREWMVVDQSGVFVTQRTDPGLAVVAVDVGEHVMSIRAPSRAPLEIPLVPRSAAQSVRIWKDRCAAEDMGDAAAEWFSAQLRRPVRLVRFAANGERHSNVEFTGATRAPVRFADGYAVLVTVNASLEALNERLATPLPMTRFRPNIVLDGLPAFAEDDIDTLTFGAAELRLVKPCVRCTVTTVDQDTGIAGVEPLPTLKKMRWSRALKGVTFGVNAIVTRPGVLSVGETAQIQRRTRAL